jgi:hypothetical protein
MSAIGTKRNCLGHRAFPELRADLPYHHLGMTPALDPNRIYRNPRRVASRWQLHPARRPGLRTELELDHQRIAGYFSDVLFASFKARRK